jgi:hypothetical protein
LFLVGEVHKRYNPQYPPFEIDNLRNLKLYVDAYFSRRYLRANKVGSYFNCDFRDVKHTNSDNDLYNFPTMSEINEIYGSVDVDKYFRNLISELTIDLSGAINY